MLKPTGFVLYQNYPNPFNAATTISFALPFQGNVNLSIYTLTGQKIREWLDAYGNAGSYSFVWNGKDRFGKDVGSGVYLYRLQAGRFVATKKMTLLW